MHGVCHEDRLQFQKNSDLLKEMIKDFKNSWEGGSDVLVFQYGQIRRGAALRVHA
jgi:hypothetical protein